MLPTRVLAALVCGSLLKNKNKKKGLAMPIQIVNKSRAQKIDVRVVKRS